MNLFGQSSQALSRAAGLLVVVLCLITSFARPGRAHDRASYGGRPARAMPVALGDFDGDSRPDVATVQMGQASPSHARYWILFQFSSGLRQSIGVTAPVGGLQIAPRDVNGDNRLDLVVSTAWLNEPVAVLLNDGHGNFSLHDANSFSASIWASQTCVASQDMQVKDAFVVLPRPLTGDRSQNQASLPPQAVSNRRVCESSPGEPFSIVISVLGRAPPAAFSRA